VRARAKSPGACRAYKTFYSPLAIAMPVGRHGSGRFGPKSAESLFFFFRIALLETIDTAGRVNKLLLARKERMAFRANFDVKTFFGRSRLNDLAAGANDRCFFVFWVNVLFHFPSYSLIVLT
jgi:hypothetical protein